MGGRGGKGNINGFIDWLSKEGKGGVLHPQGSYFQVWQYDP